MPPMNTLQKTPFAIAIPSLNPSENLVRYLRDLRKVCSEDIILVNDGSKPLSLPIFEACEKIDHVTVLSHEINHGKGRALKTAFAFLLEHNPSLISCVTCDSDGQHTIQDILRAIEISKENPQAFILGCRTFNLPEVPFRSRFGNLSFRFLFRLTTGRSITDTQTGLRVIPTDFMKELVHCPGDKYEFETRMLLQINNRALIQFPIETVYIDDNQTSHFSPLKDSWRITSVLMKAIFANFGKFILSSLLSFVVDISLFYFCYHFLFANNSKANIILSVVSARAVSLLFNYFSNLYFVFPNRNAKTLLRFSSFGKYLSLALCQMAASYALLKLVLIASSFSSQHPTFTKAVIDLLLFLVSYFIQRVFIFRNAPARQRPADALRQ